MQKDENATELTIPAVFVSYGDGEKLLRFIAKALPWSPVLVTLSEFGERALFCLLLLAWGTASLMFLSFSPHPQCRRIAQSLRSSSERSPTSSSSRLFVRCPGITTCSTWYKSRVSTG
jgi:hypothetical protein